MTREKRRWHPLFVNYMNEIINNPNYQGLPIIKKKDGTYNWIATAKSKVGKQRIKWCEEKARELGIPIQPGVYAAVMLEIHPTKWKVCQTCGKKMSLYYHYPNAHFLKELNKVFNSNFTDCDHINDIWDKLIKSGISKEKIAKFLIDKGGLNKETTTSKNEIIDALEKTCRAGRKKCLGPGAMSDFPDRFDGFHTYNRCCRSKQDKGRSRENLKSYIKDRRAYEYWSDGNIHAANQFMNSDFFKGASADHIGPISLGFVHDSVYIQRMNTSDNSAKRDRLRFEDIEKIIEIEKRTKIYPMSWYLRSLWEFIKEHYKNNQNKIGGSYRDALKQNMSNYFFILWTILDKCPTNGENFLIKVFLEPKYHYFDFSYVFNDKGNIIKKTPRHITARTKNETKRYSRIAINSIYDYTEKDNRNIVPDLTLDEQKELFKICNQINKKGQNDIVKEKIEKLMEKIQDRIIKTL